MKLGTMFQDVSTSLLRRPVTEKYPFERRTPPSRLRGMLIWDAETCVGCGLCAKDCPANALEVFVLDRKEKRFALFYYPDRCTFCAQCVKSCRHGSLAMSNEVWELAALDRSSFTIHYGDESDVELALAGNFASDAEASSES
jgi:formate hydrogenlyase subunit 6/NADH:ubiquinone oxidoreductase subunit I